MKDKLLIIGNGFDIDLGLKTSYSDYMSSDYFIKQASKSKSNLFTFLNDKYKIQKWIDLENELKIYAKLRRDEATKEDFNGLTSSLQEYLCNIKYDLNKDSTAYKVLNAVVSCNLFNKIYTFNYTHLKKIGESMRLDMNLINIEHVHGSVNEKSIILGFEDEAMVHNSNLYMIKSFSPHYSSHSIQYDLDDAKEIIFFGHSLGSTDYHYFEHFFQKQSQITKREDAKKITIFTYDNISKINILTQLRAMNNKRTDLFFNLNQFQLLCTNEERDKLKIEIFCNGFNERKKHH